MPGRGPGPSRGWLRRGWPGRSGAGGRAASESADISRSETRASSRSAFRCATSIRRTVAGERSADSPRARSRLPMIEVNGVRNSCETVETRLSLAARASTSPVTSSLSRRSRSRLSASRAWSSASRDPVSRNESQLQHAAGDPCPKNPAAFRTSCCLPNEAAPLPRCSSLTACRHINLTQVEYLWPRAVPKRLLAP